MGEVSREMNAVGFDGYWQDRPQTGPVDEQNASFDAYWEQYRKIINENECPHGKQDSEQVVPSEQQGTSG
jgi:hypothetical protein